MNGVLLVGFQHDTGCYVGAVLESTCCLAPGLTVVLTLQPVSGSPTGPGVNLRPGLAHKRWQPLLGTGGHCGLLPSAYLWLPAVGGAGPFHLCLSQPSRLQAPCHMPSIPGKHIWSPRRHGICPSALPDTSSGLGLLLPSPLQGRVCPPHTFLPTCFPRARTPSGVSPPRCPPDRPRGWACCRHGDCNSKW